MQRDARVQAVMQLASIWGIGPRGACHLYEQGYRSVSDLRSRGLHELTEQQRIGLSRHEDLQVRIPRWEVEEIERVVRSAATLLLPGVQCVVCGSYRRGNPSSGDVDFLFAPPAGEEQIDILPSLITHLDQQGFLTDHLTRVEGGVQRRKRTASYMGVCKLPRETSLYRRIDMKSYPRSIFPFAILYFTGSDSFNRSMRYYAKKVKQMSLNDKGLYHCTQVSTDKEGKMKTIKRSPVSCDSERDIFAALGLEYKEPWERNTDNIGRLTDEEAQIYGNGEDTQDSDSDLSDS
eukprot:CAMPEP_0182422788 /NCGR_PEP_ID=MMETSP1167-20130531/8576_1 /TAXON_ID=2988 /ORGANISM="Mallomonas Sp, Strain CCMP3275" /LENGTH=290 /DNA_ID=CAMNT_0024601149 /DNA_START=249 /DNA_END=1121 /DNA_ORIENTATION=+